MPETKLTDTPIVPDANAQAKAALPKPDYMAPAQDLLQGTKVQKAYDAAQNFLSEHAQHFSDKVLKPFREELDSMGEGLQTAGETGHTPTGGQLTEPTRALASGVGTLLKNVPVGKNVGDTLQANVVPPELEELGVQLHPEQIIKDAGLVYKKELTPGSGVHMFEHPDHPGLTASLHESEFTSEAVQKKMQSKLDDFGVTTKKVESAPKQVAKNASGDSAASQEALNRGKSQAAQGITHVRRDTRSGKEIPLNSIDAVDAKAGPYEQIVQKKAGGETILDSGEKARPVSGQSSKIPSVKPEYKLASPEEESASIQKWHPEAQKLKWVSPDEYLKDAGEKHISRAQVDSLKEKMKAGTPLDALWFDRDVDTGKIINQEGRHRAVAARELGIEKVPVVEYQRRGSQYVPVSAPKTSADSKEVSKLASDYLATLKKQSN